MSRRRAFLSVWLLLLGVAAIALPDCACSQSTTRAQLPTDAMLAPLGLQRAWWSYAAIDPMLDQVEFLTTDEQTTVVQSYTGMVSAIDNTNGRRVWSVQVGAPTEVRFAATTTDRLVLMVSGTTVYALDKKLGDVAWQLKVPTTPSATPTSDEANVYVASVNGAVYAYSIKTLDKLAASRELSKYGYRTLAWQYKTGRRISFPPVTNGSVLAVASNDGSLYGLSTSDHKLHYQFESDQPISAPLAQTNDRVFLATSNMKFYCLNSDSGARVWELRTGLHIQSAPHVIGDQLFLFPEEGGLHCVSAKNGAELWVNPQATAFLGATPELLYVSAGLDSVLILRRSDGRPLGSFRLYGFPIRMANERSDRLYFASERGLVLCLRERARDFPLFHKAPEKRPVLPELAPDAATKPPAAGAKKPAEDDKAAGAPAEDEAKKEGADATTGSDENAPKRPAPATKKRPAPPKKQDSE